MSGAEVFMLLGAISSVVALIEASQKVFSAARDVDGLHDSFRQVANTIPLILQILKDAKATQEQAAKDFADVEDVAMRKTIEDRSQAVQPVIASCQTNIEALQKTFLSVVPNDGDSWLQRSAKAIRSAGPGKARKVHQLCENTLHELQMLHHHHFLRSQETIAEIARAIERMSTTPAWSAHQIPLAPPQVVEPATRTAEPKQFASKEEHYSRAVPSMTFHNDSGSKIAFQGSHTINGGQQQINL